MVLLGEERMERTTLKGLPLLGWRSSPNKEPWYTKHGVEFGSPEEVRMYKTRYTPKSKEMSIGSFLPVRPSHEQKGEWPLRAGDSAPYEA